MNRTILAVGASLVPLAFLASLLITAAVQAQDLSDQEAFDNGKRLYERKEYDLALRQFELALRNWEQTLGKDHLEVGYLHGRMGHCYRDLKKHDKALQEYDTLLAIIRKHLPDDHEEMAWAYWNRGVSFSNLGRFAAARESFQEALQRRVSKQGADALPVGYCYHQIGHALFDLCDCEGALRAYQQAEQIYAQRDEEASTLEQIHALRQCSRCCWRLGRFSQAEDFLTRAEQLASNRLGAEHPGIGLAYQGKASYYTSALGQHQLSEQFVRRAIAIFESSGTSNRGDIGWAYTNLGEALGNTNRIQEAEQAWLKGIGILEQEYGPDSYSLIGAINGYVYSVHLKYGLAERGEPYARRAVAIIEKLAIPMSIITADAYMTLGKICTRLGKFEEAERHLTKAMSYFENSKIFMLCKH